MLAAFLLAQIVSNHQHKNVNARKPKQTIDLTKLFQTPQPIYIDTPWLSTN